MNSLETIGNALELQAWTYAKSYPWIPHYWVTSNNQTKAWTGTVTMLETCHYISTQGTRMLWGKSSPAIRRYVDWKGWRYWHMDYDAYFAQFDGSRPGPTEEEMQAWNMTYMLINRQKISISKAQEVNLKLKLPKQLKDFSLPMPYLKRHSSKDTSQQTSIL